MRLGSGAALTLCIAWANLAGAQAQPPAQDRINTALARARQVGIPVALLEAKVAEGKAKGVSLDRIAAAVERRESALERASQVIKNQPGTGDAELSVAADALDSGVSDAVLKAVSESAPRERRAVAIAALTELVKMGHVPEAALSRVQQALKRGPEALLNLPAEAGRGRGQAPEVPETGRGNSTATAPNGPPASVPAPGQSTEPKKPDTTDTPRGRPTNPGNSGTNPSGRGQ